jgi:hypothetical protein
VTSIVRAEHFDHDGLDQLRESAAALESTIAECAAEMSRVKTDLAAFEVRYRQEVGLLHEELDDLELAILEAEQGQLAAQRTTTAPGQDSAAGGPRAEASARFTSDGVRRLFRDVAKAIHPDLAHDEHARNRRHALMVEANHAYRLGDEERLRSILQAWEKSPEAVQRDEPDAARLRLVRRIAQMEEQLETFRRETAALRDSPLGRLKAMVDEAAARGKDLVREMTGRLKRDILVATNRLDAIRSHPSRGTAR